VKTHGVVHTGHCAHTSGGSLNCKYVIHAVGPIWSTLRSVHTNVELLHQAVLNALKTAEQLKCQSIALPAVSSEIYGFPTPLCA